MVGEYWCIDADRKDLAAPHPPRYMATYSIERYLNIRSAHSPSFGPDGVAFLMDTTGVPQVWSLDEPLGWPEQRTFHDEPISFVDWSSDSGELVYGMDEGGNERVQFYRLKDGEDENLTSAPGAKHMWGGWDSSGERYAYTANRRDESVFDVYVQGIGSKPELVLETDGWYNVATWGPESDRLVLSEARSNFDQDLYILDIDSGEKRHITPHEGNVRYGSVNWVDEDVLYLITDIESDTLYLARLSLPSLEIECVIDGGEWNVEGVNLDESGRLVYSRNLDGYSDLYTGVFEKGGFRGLPEPRIPEGVIGGTSFDGSGERLAVTVTTSTDNPNMYVVDVESGEVERWTNASTAGIPQESFRSPELVHYSSFNDREIPGFLTKPITEGEYPVVVDIHGGPESQRRPSFSAVKQYLVNHGYAVFEPNVRGSTGYGKEYTHLDDVERRMDSVRDVAEAVKWLKDRQDVDSDRIAAMGGSYGGFMVLAALTEYPSLWSAGVDIVGIANFVTFLENTGEWRRELREEEYGSLDRDREFLEEISPINKIESISAPLFVLHGRNDPRVPVGEAEQIVEKARENGVTVEKLVFDDEGHGISKLKNRVEAYSRIVEFLDTHV